MVLDDLFQDVPKDRKSTRLNSSHLGISYAVFSLKKKTGTASSQKITWCLQPPARNRFLPLHITATFFFNDPATTEIYTLSLHDALPISWRTCTRASPSCSPASALRSSACSTRSEEHTSELQSLRHLVCRLLLEKKK